jgi:hypothetical protein
MNIIINANVVKKAACFWVHNSGCRKQSVFMNELTVLFQYSNILVFDIDPQTLKKKVSRSQIYAPRSSYDDTHFLHIA